MRNIHGVWDLSFNDGILVTKVLGATNEEAGKAWFEEVNRCVLSPEGAASEPWASISDLRQWDMAPEEVWEESRQFVTWFAEHNCVFFTFVFSKKIQAFAPQQALKDYPMVGFFFDYDEAYRECANKLLAAHQRK